MPNRQYIMGWKLGYGHSIAIVLKNQNFEIIIRAM